MLVLHSLNKKVNPIIAISLTPYLSPKNPPNIWPNIVNKTTIPPIALATFVVTICFIMKISTIIGSTNNANLVNTKISVRMMNESENPCTI